MHIELDHDSRLQPAKPSHYRLPPVVQPQWRWRDLLADSGTDAAASLRDSLCQRYGVKHCLLLNRARSGIYLLCKAFGLDGEWILASLMHRPTAVVLANHCAGVVFADTDEHMDLAPDSVERMLSPRTSAILATHTYGKAADMASLRALADKHGVALIENAVHMASGLDVQGKLVGTWGDAGVLSFNVDKPLGGLLGGALLTNRDDIWEAVNHYVLGAPDTPEMRERIRTTYTAYRLKPLMLRLPGGRRHRCQNDGVADIENFDVSSYQDFTPQRIHPLQARAALALLSREASFVQSRQQHAQRLAHRLKDDTRYGLPISTPERPHAFTYYPLLVRKGSRLALGEYLAKAGIETKWRLAPLHCQKGFRDARRDDLSRGNLAWEQHLLLPLGPSTQAQDVDYLAEVLQRW